MTGDEERLRRLLGGPETAWIVERVRSRLRRGQPLHGSVALRGASEAQRLVAGRLLGRTVSTGHSVTVSLEALDRVLRESGAWPPGLASAALVLGGPIENPALRRAEEEAWQRVGAELVALAERRPELAAWVEGIRSRGHLRRLAVDVDEATAFARDLGRIIEALPADGESIAGFSARVLHRAHALDAGTPLGGLAASAAEAIGSAKAPESARARPGSAAWRRAAWASVGVFSDDLSNTVLALGLPGAQGHAAATGSAAALAHLAAHGQPAVLTLRQVVGDDLGVVPRVVFVCENPAVVSAAADRLGSRSAPLVCLQGQPGAATVSLLRWLGAGGATLRYHGDFDWGGVTIARTLSTHVAWLPWRFGASDYAEAVARYGGAGALARLGGASQATPWDQGLGEAMAERGLAVEEELVVEELLLDLAISVDRIG